MKHTIAYVIKTNLHNYTIKDCINISKHIINLKISHILLCPIIFHQSSVCIMYDIFEVYLYVTSQE